MGCKSSKVGGGGSVQRLDMKPTQIPTFDEVFTGLQEPVNKLCDLADAFDSANQSIYDLKNLKGFKKKLDKCGNDSKAIMKVIWEDLKANSVQITIEVGEDGMPTMEKPEVDSSGSDLGTAVQALFTLYEAGKTVLTTVPGLITDIVAMAETCKEFPEKAKGLAEEAGLGAMAALTAVKNTTGNCQQAASIPGSAEALVTATKDLFETLKSLA